MWLGAVSLFINHEIFTVSRHNHINDVVVIILRFSFFNYVYSCFSMLSIPHNVYTHTRCIHMKNTYTRLMAYSRSCDVLFLDFWKWLYNSRRFPFPKGNIIAHMIRLCAHSLFFTLFSHFPPSLFSISRHFFILLCGNVNSWGPQLQRCGARNEFE